jgi:hypothetical protein
MQLFVNVPDKLHRRKSLSLRHRFLSVSSQYQVPFINIDATFAVAIDHPWAIPAATEHSRHAPTALFEESLHLYEVSPALTRR